jgi:hypothetical protein
MHRWRKALAKWTLLLLMIAAIPVAAVWPLVYLGQWLLRKSRAEPFDPAQMDPRHYLTPLYLGGRLLLDRRFQEAVRPEILAILMEGCEPVGTEAQNEAA